MTTVAITGKQGEGWHIYVDGVRQERVVSLTLEMRGGMRLPVVEIVQHEAMAFDGAFTETSRKFSPTELTLRTI